MKIVFFGSSGFAVPCLKALIDGGHEIPCVVTQPDKKQGRGLDIGHTLVKSLADSLGLCSFQPHNANDADSLARIRSFSADIFVVVAYGQILSSEMLSIPKIMCLNVHASLLPLYRGAAPVNWAMINGERISGVSLIKMGRRMDAGPVIQQEKMLIEPEDDASILDTKLSRMSAALLLEQIPRIVSGDYELQKQKEEQASYAPKLNRSIGMIRWGKNSLAIHNLVRGALPWPGAFTFYNGKMLKIYKTRILSQEACCKPGTIACVTRETLSVATGSGQLLLEELQLEGKRRMKISEFLAGHEVKTGQILGKSSCKQ